MPRATSDSDRVIVDSPDEQVLTFVAGDERYAVPILSVLEIQRWEVPTRIPHASPHVLGVLNVRGDVIPIVDLRGVMGVESTTFGRTTITILFSVPGDGRTRSVGLVVDALSGVRHVPLDDRRPPPEASDRHVAAVATLQDGEMLVVLDLERVVETFCVGDVEDDG